MNALRRASALPRGGGPSENKNDLAILTVGLFLMLILLPFVALSSAVPVLGLVLAVALIASLRWARDDQLKPLRIIVVVAAVAAALCAAYGLLT